TTTTPVVVTTAPTPATEPGTGVPTTWIALIVVIVAALIVGGYLIMKRR
ncbi:MAG: hypothetical protein PWP08_1761, partial [Methanofollis sp.]|nr:hypothetical protein [Methanofollis sp.]